MAHQHKHHDGCSHDSCCPAAPGDPPQIRSGEVLWRIKAMDCATEENEIRQALADVTGIAELRVQLASRTLAIRAEPEALQQAERILRGLGYPPQVLEAGATAAPLTDAVTWHRLIAALVLAAAAEGIHTLLPASWLHEALEITLAIGAIPLAGLPVYTKGLAALRQGRLNINALMTVAVTGAFLIGHWPEAAMVMALYAIAEALEARAADRARAAISRLLELAPEQARVRHLHGHLAAAARGGGGHQPGGAGRARRTDSPRWRCGQRQQRRQSGAGHRREPAGGEGPR